MGIPRINPFKSAPFYRKYIPCKSTNPRNPETFKVIFRSLTPTASRKFEPFIISETQRRRTGAQRIHSHHHRFCSTPLTPPTPEPPSALFLFCPIIRRIIRRSNDSLNLQKTRFFHFRINLLSVPVDSVAPSALCPPLYHSVSPL